MSPDPTYSLPMRFGLSLLATFLLCCAACTTSSGGQTGVDRPAAALDRDGGLGDTAAEAGADASVLDATEPDAAPPDAGRGDARAADPQRFVAAAHLLTARSSHSSTLLADGRVLVVGGFGASGRPLASTELFDPLSGQWTPGPTMDEPRANHVALRLPSGQVLIAGGGLDNDVGAPAGRGILSSAVLFDPADGSLVNVAPLSQGRSHAAATLLEDGRALVSGGSSGAHTTQPTFGDALGTSEIYDPSVDRWTPGPALSIPRYLHSALRLRGGEVAVVGGADQTEAELRPIEILRPSDGARRDGPNLSVGRVFHAALELPSGRALVVCGKQANIRFLSSGELLAADGSEISETLALPADSRTGATLSLLPSGRALLVGGLHGSPAGFYPLADAYLYDEDGATWTAIGGLAEPRVLHSATVLQGGSVLVCGGLSGQDTLGSCERSSH